MVFAFAGDSTITSFFPDLAVCFAICPLTILPWRSVLIIRPGSQTDLSTARCGTLTAEGLFPPAARQGGKGRQFDEGNPPLSSRRGRPGGKYPLPALRRGCRTGSIATATPPTT